MSERTSHLYGLNCPACSSSRLHTLETRAGLGGIKRRRECKDCGKRFTTRERATESVQGGKSEVPA